MPEESQAPAFEDIFEAIAKDCAPKCVNAVEFTLRTNGLPAKERTERMIALSNDDGQHIADCRIVMEVETRPVSHNPNEVLQSLAKTLLPLFESSLTSMKTEAEIRADLAEKDAKQREAWAKFSVSPPLAAMRSDDEPETDAG